MAGSDIGDDHKEYFAGEAALKASGADNTMNQFAHDHEAHTATGEPAQTAIAAE